jgi:hypothetical protein
MKKKTIDPSALSNRDLGAALASGAYLVLDKLPGKPILEQLPPGVEEQIADLALDLAVPGKAVLVAIEGREAWKNISKIFEEHQAGRISEKEMRRRIAADLGGRAGGIGGTVFLAIAGGSAATALAFTGPMAPIALGLITSLGGKVVFAPAGSQLAERLADPAFQSATRVVSSFGELAGAFGQAAGDAGNAAGSALEVLWDAIQNGSPIRWAGGAVDATARVAAGGLKAVGGVAEGTAQATGNIAAEAVIVATKVPAEATKALGEVAGEGFKTAGKLVGGPGEAIGDVLGDTVKATTSLAGDALAGAGELAGNTAKTGVQVATATLNMAVRSVEETAKFTGQIAHDTARTLESWIPVPW